METKLYIEDIADIANTLDINLDERKPTIEEIREYIEETLAGTFIHCDGNYVSYEAEGI